MLRLMKLNDLFAFKVILLMWVLKFMLVDQSTPRYLAADTLSRVWLCIVYKVKMEKERKTDRIIIELKRYKNKSLYINITNIQ